MLSKFDLLLLLDVICVISIILFVVECAREREREKLDDDVRVCGPIKVNQNQFGRNQFI